jgi:hypothetical protein
LGARLAVLAAFRGLLLAAFLTDLATVLSFSIVRSQLFAALRAFAAFAR